MSNEEALAAFAAAEAAGKNNAEGLLAAAEVMNLPVVDALNTLLASGDLKFRFVRNEGWKNKEGLFLMRGDE